MKEQSFLWAQVKDPLWEGMNSLFTSRSKISQERKNKSRLYVNNDFVPFVLRVPYEYKNPSHLFRIFFLLILPRSITPVHYNFSTQSTTCPINTLLRKNSWATRNQTTNSTNPTTEKPNNQQHEPYDEKTKQPTYYEAQNGELKPH